MDEFFVLTAILVMASITCLTRIAGFLLLRNRPLGGRLGAALEAAPGSIFIALLVPTIFGSRGPDLAALAVTVLAALRLPMLPTVLTGISAAALARLALG